jgi:hypothetical protein
VARWILRALLLAGAAAAGCGGSSSHSSSSSTRTVTGHPPTSSKPAATTSAQRRPPSTQTTVNARIPATFTIGAGSAVQPPTVSMPANLPVALTVVSGDRRAHRVVVGAAKLSVPAGGRATQLIQGLRAGRYRLEIDGKPRGTLVIGVQPGP